MSGSGSTIWDVKRELMRSAQAKASTSRGGSRRLPRSLSSLQILLLVGFVSIVLLKSTIVKFGPQISWSAQVEADEEPEAISHPLNEPLHGRKRTISQIQEGKDSKEVDTTPQRGIPLEQRKNSSRTSEKTTIIEGEKPKNAPKKILTKEKDEHAQDPKTKKVDVEKDVKLKESTQGKENPMDKKSEPQKQLPSHPQDNATFSNSEQVTETVPELKAELEGDPSPNNSDQVNIVVFEEQKLMPEGDPAVNNTQEVENVVLDTKEEQKLMPEWMPADLLAKTLGFNPKNWDEQRAAWLEKHPEKRLNLDGKPRMLLVSGSSPYECRNPKGDHYLLKSIKNKIDYCRQHNIEIFYSTALLEREMTAYWAKMPVLRKLMLSHPEIEWFFWMDADAIFTDMLFEIPIDDYKDHNLVMMGYESAFYAEKSWVAINAGVFLIRNCQWTLDLFDLWAPMGSNNQVSNEVGKVLSSFLGHRAEMPADDQSALAYLILTRKELQSKVKLVKEYEFSGYWVDHVNHYEEYMANDRPGLGDRRWPFITHFTGCQTCTGLPNPAFEKLNCLENMERAFNFADNQVLHTFGFLHEDLGSPHVKRIKEDEAQTLDSVTENTWATTSESLGSYVNNV